MIYYTVKTGCDDCATIQTEYNGVEYSYRKNQTPLEYPVFFGVLYYNSDPKVREIFTEHKFKTVPYIAVSQN